MSNGSRRRLSRGDRRRNEKLARLRAIITRETAVLAFDLAADKQVCAVTDPDSRVLARRTVRCKAWELAEAVAWGLARAAEAGFSSVVVACEPTGHRWRVLDQIAAEHGVALVCVQPLLVARAREAEDFTRNKNDDADAMIIARLVCELRCYLPERADPTWARLRHLGARRAGLVTAAGAARQQVRDLLECAWPAVLDAAGQPLDSRAGWPRSPSRLDRVAATGDLGVLDRRGGTVRRRGPRRAGRHPLVLGDRARGVRRRHRPRARPRSGSPGSAPAPWNGSGSPWPTSPHLRAQITEVEARMLGVLDALGLTELVTTIPGVSPVGAATILAESGDPTRFSSARALVKHAGLCPRDNSSGTYQGKTGISGRGRPELRLAAWRAVFAALRHNPVLAARHAHLTGRADNPLTDTQARDRRRGQPAAPAARRDRHPHRLGPRHRRRPRPAPSSGAATAA